LEGKGFVKGNIKHSARIARHKRVRKKLSGTSERPRMTVFRSARHIYVQIVDDMSSVTLASASTMSKDFRESGLRGGNKEAAKKIGEEIAKKARDKQIEAVLFDRGGYKFHGRVKTLADAAKEAGLKF
jgi:large subunit ribosomal protein L18